MSQSIPRELAIERALGLFADLVESRPAVASELERSRSEFFGSGTGDQAPDSELRLLEWFLFERDSESLGGVAARALAEAWLERAGPELAALFSGLLESRVGIFELTSIEPGRGVWVSDMAGGGEYPLEDRGLAFVALVIEGCSVRAGVTPSADACGVSVEWRAEDIATRR